MGVAISINRLRDNLITAPETKDFPHPQNLLKNSSDGLKYLFEKAYLDLLIDKKYHTEHIDFDAFDIEDIYDLYEFCLENCSHRNSKELGALWKIFSDCRDSKPKLKAISFI